jgi:hypothetical protein
VQGSEVEIEATKTRDTREPLVVQISRRRRDFKQSFKFSDKDSQVSATGGATVKLRVLRSGVWVRLGMLDVVDAWIVHELRLGVVDSEGSERERRRMSEDSPPRRPSVSACGGVQERNGGGYAKHATTKRCHQ